MTEILYLGIGAVVGGMVIFLLPYLALRRTYNRVINELTDVQAKNNELQSAMLEQQSTNYQARQTMLAQQKRIESELKEAHERHVALGKQIDEANAQIEQQQQKHLGEIKQLRETIARMEQEQIALQNRFAQEVAQWDRERPVSYTHLTLPTNREV